MAILDPAHGAKNASLMPLSMARVLVLGCFAVLSMQLVDVQLHDKASGLHACDVNGSDRMDVGAALRRLNFAVRRSWRQRLGTFGSIVYSYFMACTMAAFFDRDPQTTPRMRCRWAMLNLVFLRYWYSWCKVTGAPKHQFISVETFVAFLVKDMGLLLLALMYARPEFRMKPFAPWLWGSNQIEHMLSEWRAFEAGNTTWTLRSVINICRRWLFQRALFARADVHLPPTVSNSGYSRTRFDAAASAQYVQSDYPTAAELLAMYTEVVGFVQQVLVALGMAQALHDAGMWDEPPLEDWAEVQAAAAAAAEAAAAQADEVQFEGQALQQEAATAAAERTEAEGAQEEAQEEAAAAAADAAAAAMQRPARGRQAATWRPGDRYVIDEIMEHANRGATIGFETGAVKITERYYLVRFAGAQWRARRYWTWQPASELLEVVPALVGEYCEANKLQVPAAWRERVAAAMAEEVEVAAAEAEAEAQAPTGAPGRPPSQTPIPAVDVDALLGVLTAAVGDEQANTHVKKVVLPSTASAAQRRQHAAMFVWNEETEQTEHKQTTMARDQKKHADDKTAPGRLRYRFGRRLAIRSEDDGARTGFWCGRVYQVHRPAQIVRQLQTKGGPLLLEGHLEVGYARIDELRKGLGVASVQHPRLSVRRDDARRCEAVLQMLTREGGVLREDRRSPPQLAPAATLGCKVEARERPGASSCACWTPAEYDSLAEAHDCGGASLQST